MEPQNQGKTKTIVMFIVLIIIVAGIGVGVWWYLTKYTQGMTYDSFLKWGQKKTEEKKEAGQTTDETKDWKTYANQNFGFSIKYPTNWFVYRKHNLDYLFSVEIANEQLQSQQPPTKTYMSLALEIFQKGYKLPNGNGNEEFLSENTDVVYFLRIMNGLFPQEFFDNSYRETKTIGGKEAIRYISKTDDSNISPWVLKDGSNFYQIRILKGESVNDTEAEKIINQMLSTFKFTK